MNDHLDVGSGHLRLIGPNLWLGVIVTSASCQMRKCSYRQIKTERATPARRESVIWTMLLGVAKPRAASRLAVAAAVADTFAFAAIPEDWSEPAAGRSEVCRLPLVEARG